MLSGRNKSAPVAAYVIHQLPVFLAERRWQPVMGASTSTADKKSSRMNNSEGGGCGGVERRGIAQGMSNKWVRKGKECREGARPSLSSSVRRPSVRPSD